jgi:peptidoglycan/LPS O-acetylase OafA/YrhL
MADEFPRNSDDTKASIVAAEAERTVSAAGSAPSRLAFIDGLRGLAALGIAVYHIWRYEPALATEPPTYPAEALVPGLVQWMLLRSWVGVQFLLVISGFVIALTLRDTWVTPREVVSFLGRRVVRLGPPYWVTLAFVLALHGASVSWWNLPSPFEEPVTFVRVAAHAVFLQDVLGQTPLSAAIWTVCIEIQFYVVSVLGWGLAQRLRRGADRRSPQPSATGLMLVFAPLALASLADWNRRDSTEPWVTHFLCSFFLGMLTFWTLDRRVSARVFELSIAVVAGHLAVQWKLENALALTAALAIFVAGRTNHFHDWLRWRWLQYLGQISYSLYLIHYPVSHLVTWLGWRWCGNSPTPVQSSLILLACLVASLLAGHFLYVAVEVPAGRWSAWLKARWPAH